MEVFYSYAPQARDEVLLGELEKHLSTLKREGVISDWHTGKITPGTERDAAIQEKLDTAELILLLISSDFIASDDIWNLEVEKAMQRHQAGKARVIPIILRDCDYRNTLVGKLQVLPRNERAITTWNNQDEAWTNVVQEIRKVCSEINGGKPNEKSNHTQESLVKIISKKHDDDENQSLYKRAKEAINTLDNLITESKEVERAIDQQRDGLEALCKQIEIMTHYKRLHDLLQKYLQSMYEIIDTCIKQPKEQIAWNELNNYYSKEFKNTHNKFLDIVNTTSFKEDAQDENWWIYIERLDDTLTFLFPDAIKFQNLKLLGEVTSNIGEILDILPSSINDVLFLKRDFQSFLFTSPFERIIGSLSELISKLNIDDHKLRKIQDGIDALKQLKTLWNELIKKHNCWQRIDNQLRLLADDQNWNRDNLDNTRQTLNKIIDQTHHLCIGNISNSIAEYKRKSRTIQDEFTTSDLNRIRASFDAYYNASNKCFQEIDTKLLKLYENLDNDIGSSLGNLLRIRRLT